MVFQQTKTCHTRRKEALDYCRIDLIWVLLGCWLYRWYHHFVPLPPSIVPRNPSDDQRLSTGVPSAAPTRDTAAVPTHDTAWFLTSCCCTVLALRRTATVPVCGLAAGVATEGGRRVRVWSNDDRHSKGDFF